MYDLMYLSIAVILVVLGMVMSFYLLRVRSVIRNYREAGDILSEMISSLYKVIDEKEQRVIDLMYRIDLLEVSLNQRRNVTFEERVSSSDVTRDVTRAPKLVGKGGLSVTEQSIIALLQPGSRRVFEITKELGKSREHTSRVLSRLWKEGFVERSSIGGSVSYSLTEKGRGS